ncbi:phosphatase PAP2 family protein [Ideonella sp. A 288]|uniref:phosphatase PAP2 family protein n=1 Tax=Ideonella sp. A 288 TaxID=1962181 RepID=UPI001F3A890B|nr:phosphatase PAP2 family protein [Ideonella sp. A 288]
MTPMSLVPPPRSRAAPMLMASALLVAAPAQAQSQRSAGNFLATAIPLGTLATELYRGDRDGARQFAATFMAATASTEVLKRVTDVQRPDESNNLSFPSGHAARAFSSAAYVRHRHGLEAAAPLYLAALYVGHTRVSARRHRWADIAGAAVVSEIAAAYLVRRAPDAPVSMLAVLDRGYVGVHVTLNW